MHTMYLIALIFFVIAFVFSMLGLGGSQLYIPILFWMRLDFKTQAIPLGMLLNVVNSASAAWTYGRKKLIQWGLAIPFGLSMIILAPAGAWANIKMPTRLVILIFALFTAAAAILMLSGWKPKRGQLSQRDQTTLGISGGGILGFFAGLIGRGGGSFVVPLLYIAGLEPRLAAATSAFVVTLSGTSSFLSHTFTAARPDWPVWGLCVISVFLGSQAGSRLMAGKLQSVAIKTIFGVVLLGVAALLIVRDVI